MNNYYFFVFVGVVVTLLPFVGVPQGFKDIVFTLAGLVIIFFGQRLVKSSHEALQKTDVTRVSDEENRGE